MYNLPHILQNRNQSQVDIQLMNIRDITTQISVLSDFPYLEKLSLHGNLLKTLPNMEGLKSLVLLNVTKNPLKINKHLIDSLYSLKKLESLYIDCTQQQAMYICQHLTNLRFLNGKDVIRQLKMLQDQSYKISQMQQLKREQQQIKQLYRELAELNDKMQGFGNISLTEKQVNQQIRIIIRQYSLFEQSVNNKKSKEAIKHYSKNKMLEIIDQVMIGLLSQGQICDSDALALLVKINNKKKFNFQSILRTILQISFQECVDGQIVQEVGRFRKQNLYLKQISRLKKENVNLNRENKQLRHLNQKYLQKIHGLANGQYKRSKKTTPKSKVTPTSKGSDGLARSHSQINFDNLNKMNQRMSKSNVRRFGETQQLRKNASELSISKMQIKQSSSKAQLINLNQQRLTLDKTLQLADQIAKEKAIQNHQNLLKKEQFQTMEQFLFTFFFRKYGLKQMALNWSLTFINAIKQHSRKSGLVHCFGKILKNQLQEDFYHKQKKFQDKLKFHLGKMGAKRIKLAKVKYFGKQNLGDDSQSQKSFRTFSAAQVNSLITNVFCKVDYTRQWLDQKLGWLNYPISQGETFKFLSQINLELYQIKIRNLLRIFRKYDREDKGYLSKTQMLKLLRQYLDSVKEGSYDGSFEEPQMLLMKMNPQQQNKILISMYLTALTQ